MMPHLSARLGAPLHLRLPAAFAVLVFAPTCSSAAQQCEFKSSVNLTFCGSLVGHKEVKTMAACRAKCCADPDCGMYEWCPNAGQSDGCAHWASALW